MAVILKCITYFPGFLKWANRKEFALSWWVEVLPLSIRLFSSQYGSAFKACHGEECSLTLRWMTLDCCVFEFLWLLFMGCFFGFCFVFLVSCCHFLSPVVCLWLAIAVMFLFCWVWLNNIYFVCVKEKYSPWLFEWCVWALVHEFCNFQILIHCLINIWL